MHENTFENGLDVGWKLWVSKVTICKRARGRHSNWKDLQKIKQTRTSVAFDGLMLQIAICHCCGHNFRDKRALACINTFSVWPNMRMHVCAEWVWANVFILRKKSSSFYSSNELERLSLWSTGIFSRIDIQFFVLCRNKNIQQFTEDT